MQMLEGGQHTVKQDKSKPLKKCPIIYRSKYTVPFYQHFSISFSVDLSAVYLHQVLSQELSDNV